MASATQLPAPGDTVQVKNRFLAAALTAFGVPRKTALAGGTWAAATNVYSEQFPSRRNNIRVAGDETFFFEPTTADKRVKTVILVQAWDEAGELTEGDPQPQAEREIEAIAEEIQHADMTDKRRAEMAARLRFWHVVAQMQGARVALDHYILMTRRATDAAAFPPLIKWKRPNGNTNFYNADKSRL